ncbi:hypothetical protein [Mycolicibacterium mageritense]|uniref:hypothetical protein n=1 Tax=Mycolicibacterium mageritense TaxID=53462 RepID=UPI002572E7EC|nr:hypothetical protein [Mycolicibacterium mageritense]
MKSLLLRPPVHILLTAIGLTCAALLAGIPLVVKGLPVWFYASILGILLISQTGQMTSFFIAHSELGSERIRLSRQLTIAGLEAIRNVVIPAIEKDAVCQTYELDVKWAVRVRSVEDKVLLSSAQAGGLNIENFRLLDASGALVRVVSSVGNSGVPGRRSRVFGGCQSQAATGFRFEVFYELPGSIPEREGRVLGGTLLAVLRDDAILGFIATRLL